MRKSICIRSALLVEITEGLSGLPKAGETESAENDVQPGWMLRKRKSEGRKDHENIGHFQS